MFKKYLISIIVLTCIFSASISMAGKILPREVKTWSKQAETFVDSVNPGLQKLYISLSPSTYSNEHAAIYTMHSPLYKKMGHLRANYKGDYFAVTMKNSGNTTYHFLVIEAFIDSLAISNKKIPKSVKTTIATKIGKLGASGALKRGKKISIEGVEFFIIVNRSVIELSTKIPKVYMTK